MLAPCSWEQYVRRVCSQSPCLQVHTWNPSAQLLGRCPLLMMPPSKPHTLSNVVAEAGLDMLISTACETTGRHAND